jgi:hypothetical protein
MKRQQKINYLFLKQTVSSTKYDVKTTSFRLSLYFYYRKVYIGNFFPKVNNGGWKKAGEKP